jgi:hypothetical protein
MSEQLATEKLVSPAAKRMRLTRQRRANGLRCVTLEIRDSEIDALVARGLLADRNDPEAIVQSLYVLLDRVLE